MQSSYRILGKDITREAGSALDSLPKLFGQCIRDIRLERGIASQERLGELSGLHRTFIGKVERGETNLTLTNMERLAKALDVSLSEIFTRIENLPPR